MIDVIKVWVVTSLKLTVICFNSEIFRPLWKILYAAEITFTLSSAFPYWWWMTQLTGLGTAALRKQAKAMVKWCCKQCRPGDEWHVSVFNISGQRTTGGNKANGAVGDAASTVFNYWRRIGHAVSTMSTLSFVVYSNVRLSPSSTSIARCDRYLLKVVKTYRFRSRVCPSHLDLKDFERSFSSLYRKIFKKTNLKPQATWGSCEAAFSINLEELRESQSS